ncbi:MAG: hypothetical protein Ta2F_07330 [Termitinemataceae bacterium]|nr:MAG: hypothetical protein Ta2F_07330 [Termitinemataceae bacterium]
MTKRKKTMIDIIAVLAMLACVLIITCENDFLKGGKTAVSGAGGEGGGGGGGGGPAGPFVWNTDTIYQDPASATLYPGTLFGRINTRSRVWFSSDTDGVAGTKYVGTSDPITLATLGTAVFDSTDKISVAITFAGAANEAPPYFETTTLSIMPSAFTGADKDSYADLATLPLTFKVATYPEWTKIRLEGTDFGSVGTDWDDVYGSLNGALAGSQSDDVIDAILEIIGSQVLGSVNSIIVAGVAANGDPAIGTDNITWAIPNLSSTGYLLKSPHIFTLGPFGTDGETATAQIAIPVEITSSVGKAIGSLALVGTVTTNAGSGSNAEDIGTYIIGSGSIDAAISASGVEAVGTRFTWEPSTVDQNETYNLTITLTEDTKNEIPGSFTIPVTFGGF